MKKNNHSTKTVLYVGNHLSLSGKNSGISEQLSPRLEKRGWNLILTSRYSRKIFRLFDMLLTVLTHRKFYSLAVVDVYSGLAFIWAFLCGWLLKIIGKPFILVLRGGNLPDFSLAHERFVRKLFSCANVITSTSDYLKENLNSFSQDIKIIPNAIEIQNYPFDLRGKPRPKVVWLRAFHNIYNPSMVPEILSVLRSNGIKANCIMVGPDKDDGSLQNMLEVATKLNVKDQIEVVPGVPKAKVPGELSRGDIFLNTTNYDNTPVSVIEAMACGLCVVSTDVGGLPYLLEDGVDALLVPPDDPDAMAAAVLRLLKEPNLASKLSQNARKKAEGFDWSIVLPMWEKLFKQIIEDHHGSF